MSNAETKAAESRTITVETEKIRGHEYPTLTATPIDGGTLWRSYCYELEPDPDGLYRPSVVVVAHSMTFQPKFAP